METISSNHFSHDLQVQDVMEYLEHNDGVAYAHLMNMFPEFYNVAWDGSWYDTTLMGVDPEWSCWVTDEIEACTTIMWLEGEPFFVGVDDFNQDPDEFFDGWWGSTDDDSADAHAVGTHVMSAILIIIMVYCVVFLTLDFIARHGKDDQT